MDTELSTSIKNKFENITLLEIEKLPPSYFGGMCTLVTPPIPQVCYWAERIEHNEFVADFGKRGDLLIGFFALDHTDVILKLGVKDYKYNLLPSKFKFAYYNEPAPLVPNLVVPGSIAVGMSTKGGSMYAVYGLLDHIPRRAVSEQYNIHVVHRKNTPGLHDKDHSLNEGSVQKA